MNGASACVDAVVGVEIGTDEVGAVDGAFGGGSVVGGALVAGVGVEGVGGAVVAAAGIVVEGVVVRGEAVVAGTAGCRPSSTPEVVTGRTTVVEGTPRAGVDASGGEVVGCRGAVESVVVIPG